MQEYAEKEIVSLIERFKKRQLPKVEWTHEAHLLVAIWYCSYHPFEVALKLVREGISAHNESVGTPNTDTEGYHETITKFWLRIAYDFSKKHNSDDITILTNDFIRSPKGKSNFPLNYYSSALLFSIKARHNWIEPDLKSLGE